MSISITNLSKTYCLKNECKNVLTDVNLSLLQGQIFALMGKNGAGKTTLLKILSTLMLPTSGQANICGWDLALDQERVRGCIGLSADPDTCFYQMLSLRENIKFYGRLFNIKKDKLNTRMNELSSQFGLEGFMDVKLNNCPSGVKQKLAVLRSLLADPKVILMDEPTRSLDKDSKIHILAYIKTIVKEYNKTCIMITHDAEEAKAFADKIGHLENGRISV